MDKIKDLLPSIDLRSQRIIADHIKASVFLLFDGVEPSNKDRGYVLRRLIRRAIVYANKNDIHFNSRKLKSIAQIVLDIYKDTHPEFKLKDKRADILNKLSHETRKFRATIERGLKEFENRNKIDGKEAFVLFSTYGFPFEMTKELAKEKGIEIDEKEFQKEFEKHQELSRTATAGKFKSGLADDSEQVKKLHTATHLLLAALRKVLGDHVVQKGSNITGERLRFDFSHPEKVTPEQIKKVEEIVNEQIKKDLPICCEEMSLEEAKERGAMGVFESKYDDKIKVYSVGDIKTPFSCEICGGPHVDSTGKLGGFKIKKEESSSAGIRRIKAVLE